MSSLILLLLATQISAANDEFKPYLHNAVVPKAPDVKLYGTYQTELFPGAATYSYQIEVPPGTNGLQPLLTLAYNSQNVKQRPGILGAGWNLPAIYLFRDANYTLNDTSDDKFRLVFYGTVHDLVYDQSDNQYHTEIESYMRIQNLSTAANDKGIYWLVTAKDGMRYTLGNYTASELTSNTGRNYTLKWSLDKVEDTYGNNISYTYSENPYPEDNGSVYLTKILYNNEQSRKAEFSYEANARPDLRRVYEQGNNLEESRRLAAISVYANGALVRNYNLEYKSLNPENTLSSLSKISFFGSDGTSELHNVQFDYYNSTHGFANYTEYWAPPEIFQIEPDGDQGVRLVDINNDGFVDIIRGSALMAAPTVWINNKTNGWNNESEKWKFPLNFIDKFTDDNSVRFADLNGDGFVDVVQSMEENQSITKQAYLNNGSGFVNVSDTWIVPVIFLSDTVGARGVHDEGLNFIELNGDGLPDLIQANKPVQQGPVTKLAWLNNGSGWTQTDNWTAPSIFIGTDYVDNGLRVVDLNGDGLDDLIEAQATADYPTANVWLNTGFGWTANLSPEWGSPVNFTEGGQPDTGARFADVNGDGLADLLLNGMNVGNPVDKVWINNGSNWIESGWKSPDKFVKANKNIGRRIADVNGDGFADIIVSFKNTTHTEQWVWIKNATVPYTLKSIKTELGANISISYRNSTAYNNTNSSGISQLGFNILVVDSVIQNSSVAGSFNTITDYSYNYSGGRYDYKSKEFSGFATVTEILPDSSVVKHYFHQDTALKGKENRTEIYDSKGSIFYREDKDYNFTKSNGIYKTVLISTATYTNDGTSNSPKITNTTFTYDNYNNLRKAYYLGDISSSGDEKTELYDYVYNTSANILNTQSWYRLFAADNVTRLRDVKYIYDGGIYGSSPSRGDVTAIESWLDTGQLHRVEFGYGSKGQLVTETDALGRVTKYRYDALTKTFPEQAINPLGHVTRFSYDPGTGNLLWSEKNGIRTEFTYDQFGRVHKEVQPYDATAFPTKVYNYSFDGTAPETIKVSQRTTTNKSLETYYYYDGFGNLVQIKTPANDGNQVIRNFFYDGLARVKAEQNPYFATFSTTLTAASSTAKYTNYSYDTMSRVTNVTNPDGTTTTITFNRGNISTFDENNHRKDYYIDAYDRIIKITEYNTDPTLKNGVIYTYNTTYNYDAANQLTHIIDAYGNNYSFTYDTLGRRIRLNDPDIGEWNYTYDLNGNLISQAGGGGNLVSGDGFYREYNSLNQLVAIRNGSSNSPILEQYYYDPFGERIKIWRNDSANTVVYTPFKELMRIINSSGTYDYSYIYDGSTLVARVNPDNTKWYYHPDHLGSTTLITDGSGNVVEETFYEPYGEVDSGGTADVKLYTGQFSDEATGQYYYGARYYMPQWGKFIQPDPIFLDLGKYRRQRINLLYNPQRLNQYTYALNNPFLYKDPTGAIVIYAGLAGSVGFFGGTSGSTGFALSFSFGSGFQFGRYDKYGGGLVTPTLSGAIEIGIAPLQKNLEEFSGYTIDVGGDIGELVSLGAGGSLPFEEDESDKRSYKLSKSAVEITGTILDLNPPILPVSAYGLQSFTSTHYIAGENKNAVSSSSGGGSSFINSRTGKQVKLNPGETYDPRKDDIIKSEKVNSKNKNKK